LCHADLYQDLHWAPGHIVQGIAVVTDLYRLRIYTLSTSLSSSSAQALDL
jgi:hypothetical protein